MTTRFSAALEGATTGAHLILDANQSHHLLRVMRAKPGFDLRVFGSGREFDAVLRTQDNQLAVVELCAEVAVISAASLRIIFALPWLKGGKTELLVQKLTELGVSEIVIYGSTREVAHGSDTKLERLKSVAVEACKQCERGEPPEISGQSSLRDVIESCGLPAKQCLVLYEREKTTRFSCALEAAGIRKGTQAQPAILIASGPEGGFSETEIASVARRVVAVSLGSRILRAETAPIAAVGAALAICGEF